MTARLMGCWLGKRLAEKMVYLMAVCLVEKMDEMMARLMGCLLVLRSAFQKEQMTARMMGCLLASS